uniref:Uncharacterized protein n=1 Tax=Ciona intestinalis TaxID=7719 RepID=F7BJS1_CIOIN
MFASLVFVLSLAACSHAYSVQQPIISLMEPTGLMFMYPDDGNINLVSYHYSINTPLPDVQAGTYNQDVSESTNGYFTLQNFNVAVVPGDEVNYWVNVITSTGGYLLTDQTWVAQVNAIPETYTGPTTTTPAKTNPPTQPPTQPPTNSPTNPPIVSTTEPPATAPPATGPPGVTTTTASSGGSGGTGGGGPAYVCSSYPCDSQCDMSVAPCNGLIFEETWDQFDLNRWQHEITMSGGGNWEFEYYTNNRTNSYVRDNTLFIKPTLTADHYGEEFLSTGTLDLWGGSPADLCTMNAFWGCQRTGSGSNYINPIQSARLRTVNSFSFKYGRVEIEAKMPTGDWIWPAMWLLPKTNSYGSWPASGEIDICESRGNTDLKDDQGVSHGNDAMGSTLHWGPYWPVNAYEKTTKETLNRHGTFASEFHSYVMDWDENKIKFTIDGEELMTVDPGASGFWEFGEFDTVAPGSDNPWKDTKNKMTPFDQEFYLILNVAVGGTNGFFPDTWTNGKGAKPWNNNSPTAFKDFWMGKNSWYPTWQPDVNNGENAAMQVKTIRVWAK